MKSKLMGLLVLVMASAARAETEAPVTPFAGTLYQSIAAIVVFVLLMMVLRRYAWGPILKGLQEREGKIKADLERAEEAKRQAAAALASYQAQLAQAQVDARKIIDQGRSDAEKIAAHLRDQTQTEINQMRQQAQQEILAAKQRAVSELYAQAATLATNVAGRVLKRELTPQDQERLLRHSLEEVGKQA